MERGKTIDELAIQFKLLSDETRLRILALLRERSYCVNELVVMLNQSQPSISQHLKKLREHNFVSVRRNKQTINYSLNTKDFPELKLYLVEIASLKEELSRLDNISQDC
jgi:ArsR family transcriptional regulator